LWPVVAIGTAYFNNRDYGRIPKPAFTIVDWAEPWAQPSDVLPDPEANKVIEAPKAGTSEAPTQTWNTS
jgi:hypothetical protein